nr:unnamed protein product [Callosobruchus analis]
MKTICPLYKIPGWKKITTLITQKYEALSDHTKQRFLSVKHFCLTVDIWTETLNTVSYSGFTCHFLYESKIKNVTIVTTDNGKNIVKAVTELYGKNKHAPYFAHTLDLIVTKVVDETSGLSDVVNKVKVIVKFFKQSVVPADNLRKIQKLNSEEIFKLIQSEERQHAVSFAPTPRHETSSGYSYGTSNVVANRLSHMSLAEAHPDYSQQVYRWKLQFDGQSSVTSFLEQISEMQSSRGVSDSQLLRAGPEIFTKDALLWYRTRVRVVESIGRPTSS